MASVAALAAAAVAAAAVAAAAASAAAALAASFVCFPVNQSIIVLATAEVARVAGV